MLSLTDIFESNTKNQGLISREDGNRMIFDHLLRSNGIFPFIDYEEGKLGSFSPRQRTGHRFVVERAKDSGFTVCQAIQVMDLALEGRQKEVQLTM